MRQMGIGVISAVTEPKLSIKNPHNPNVDSPGHNFYL